MFTNRLSNPEQFINYFVN